MERVRAPEDTCTPSSSAAPGKCEQTSCTVLINGQIYCSKCSKLDEHLVDGKCVAASEDANSNCVSDTGGACSSCAKVSFMYQGGCYQTGGQNPGNTLCTVASDGKCTTAAEGYFVLPGADASHDSVVSCGDAANGVTLGDNKKYVGVANCAKCNAPGSLSAAGTVTATCTECTAGFLHASSGSTSCVAECPKGYFGHTDNSQKKTCQSCSSPTSGLTPSVTGIPDCASCTYIGGDSGTLTCSECENGKKPSLDGTSCNTCKDTNCAFCNSQQVCEGCTSGYILDGAACTQQTCSTPDCKTCNNPKTANEACTACVSTHYLTPTSQCIADCAALSGYYGDADKTCKRCGVANCEACNAQGQCQTCRNGFYLDTKECKACDSSCKSCSGATTADCTECPAGKALKYGSDGTKGTCGEGCVVSVAQASGNCKTCDLTVEGTKYCSECAMESEYPQTGVCVGAAGGRAITCTTPGTGVCTTCANGLLKMNGGCYETTRYPGKSVCTEAASTGGTCQTAAPGYKVDTNGTLVTCSEGCKTCSDASTCTACADGYVKLNNAQTCSKCDASCLTCETNASTCKECASGYYKTASGSTCTSCESNSGDVKGVGSYHFSIITTKAKGLLYRNR